MHTYKKRYTDSEGSYEIIQIREGEDDRIVSELHYDYLDFIEAGNSPEIVEFVPDPEPTLEQVKEAKREEIRNKRKQAEYSGILWNTHEVGTTESDQVSITLAMLKAQSDSTYSMIWKFSGGEFVTIDATDIVDIVSLIRSHIQSKFDKESQLNDLIDSATAVAEVEGISWDS